MNKTNCSTYVRLLRRGHDGGAGVAAVALHALAAGRRLPAARARRPPHAHAARRARRHALQRGRGAPRGAAHLLPAARVSILRVLVLGDSDCCCCWKLCYKICEGGWKLYCVLHMFVVIVAEDKLLYES